MGSPAGIEARGARAQEGRVAYFLVEDGRSHGNRIDRETCPSDFGRTNSIHDRG